MSAIRMLLVGDNVDFVEGLRDWLVKESDIEIVGIEHSGVAAVDRIVLDRPQLVLMDVTMSGMSGFEACKRIRSNNGSPGIVLMTFHESETVRQEAWAAGADAVVGKVQIALTLLSVIRELAGEKAKSTDLEKTQEPRLAPGDPAP